MSRWKRWSAVGALALGALAVAAVGVTAASGGHEKKKKTIIVGVAMDLTDGMKPFNSPALAAAQIEAKKIAAAGGPRFTFKICDDQAKNQQACAAQVIHQGAKIGLVTCDVDLKAPATQEFINNGILAVAPCVTTDAMGPQKYGKVAGRLAFTFGSTAQDEGSVEAEYAYSRGWRTAIVVKDNYLLYFRNVSDAFAKRFQQLGGKIVD